MSKIKEARAELEANVKQAQDDLSKAEGKLKKFDEVFGEEAPARKKPGPKPKAATTTEAAASPKPRGKPGPKPKAEKAPGAPAKPRGKPGPKPKPKAEKVETPKTEGKSRAAEGRRAVARGERPPIKLAMAQVMGDDTCNPAMVAERLAAKGWTPSAQDPKTYCGYMLSSNKDMFERVPAKGRGFYKVKAAAVTAAETKADPTPAAKAEPVEAKPAKTANGKPSTDDILKEAGFDGLAGTPFG